MTLTPERFVALQQVWEAILERPPEEWARMVRDATPDDSDLRAELESLLAAHQTTDDSFDRPLVAQLGMVGSGLAAASLVGRTLGPWRVTREIGAGGMGMVYEAVRADDQFTRRVAIKTLRTGADRADVLRRFARERQIHAALAHPNIATLLDAGITDDVIPYMVLEYVDGLPVDVYCDARCLALPERLDLFRQVVQAVQHAHRRLVVHRDLKPSNILVTGDGVVKLLDFGISTLLEESPDHAATDGPRAFTTAYASPEQIRGEPVSTATDIYSLGVVLYRLLAGRPPHDLDSLSTAAAWATICEVTPPPPSAVVTLAAARAAGLGSAERLTRALRGELDAIVLMALRKEPDRRYPTADALAEDLHNHLRGQPVSARPDTTAYRIRKLVRRNRLATAAVALAALAMAGGAGISLWQARQARRSAAVAEQQRRTATGVAEFLQTIVGSADLSWAGQGLGPNATIAEAVDSAAGRIDVELAQEPAVAEALHRILVSIYAARRDPTLGTPHARRLLELLRQRQASDQEMARGLHDLGLHLYLAGERDSSRQLLQDAYRLMEHAGFPEGEDLVVILNQLGLLALADGDYAGAEDYMARTLELRRRTVGSDHVAAVAASNIGVARDSRGDVTGAIEAFREAESIHASLVGAENFERGTNFLNLANSLLLTGQVEEAERVMREALSIWERTVGPNHLLHAIGRIDLSRIRLAAGDPVDALAQVRTGIALLGDLPPEHLYRSRGASREAAALLALGRADQAESEARRALTILRGAYPPGDWRTAETELVLGQILMARGATEAGRAHLTQSHKVIRAALGEDDPRSRRAAAILEAAGLPPK